MFEKSCALTVVWGNDTGCDFTICWQKSTSPTETLIHFWKGVFYSQKAHFTVKLSILLSKGSFYCRKTHFTVKRRISLTKGVFYCQKAYFTVENRILLSKGAFCCQIKHFFGFGNGSLCFFSRMCKIYCNCFSLFARRVLNDCIKATALLVSSFTPVQFEEFIWKINNVENGNFLKKVSFLMQIKLGLKPGPFQWQVTSKLESFAVSCHYALHHHRMEGVGTSFTYRYHKCRQRVIAAIADASLSS